MLSVTVNKFPVNFPVIMLVVSLLLLFFALNLRPVNAQAKQITCADLWTQVKSKQDVREYTGPVGPWPMTAVRIKETPRSTLAPYTVGYDTAPDSKGYKCSVVQPYQTDPGQAGVKLGTSYQVQGQPGMVLVTIRLKVIEIHLLP